ncbi:exopolyphosphatase PRUNE1 [Ambystoma mexicanum]|uniref:exopolyphosphatase PRUNE1 n=1 Tax=Ambystoma mexicanum TaxID=8296 RepID=UPI0037E87FDF
MECFLQGCKAALRLSDQESLGVHVVLGNEACDLDSMVSAIALAYLHSKTSSETKLAFVPVLNIPREDFPLRSEGTFLLKKNGIRDGHLIFREEIDLLTLHEAGLLSLTLVDHNVLPREDEALEEAVTEVIDHHALERKPSPSCKVTTEAVGSCTTLVAEKIFKEAPHLLDTQLASLLHGTIVLDCVNMATAAGKVTPKDAEYVNLLESRFPDLPQRGVIFDLLQKAKFDITGLTTEQLLRKDLKALGSHDVSLSISAIYMTLEDFLQRPNVQQELCNFCRKHGYNVWVGMTISFSDQNEPQRQLAVYSRSEHLRELVCRALEQADDPHLKLSPLHSPCPDIQTYLQGNTIASRKKVLPIIKAFLRERDQKEAPAAAMDRGHPKASIRWQPDAHWSGGEEGLEDEDLGESTDAAKTCLHDDLRCKGYYSGCRTQVEDSLMDDDVLLPPTPMNSLVEGCPLDRGLPKLTAEALLEKFSQITASDSNRNNEKK